MDFRLVHTSLINEFQNYLRSYIKYNECLCYMFYHISMTAL